MKWHLKTKQGIQCLTDEAASKIAGEDLDYHRRDLHTSIEQAKYPQWQVQIQKPNSQGGPIDDKRFSEPPLKIYGDADRYDHQKGNDNYTQAGNLYRLMSEDQKKQLISNIVRSMKSVPNAIQ